MNSVMLYEQSKYKTKQITVFINGNPNYPGKKIKITSSKADKWHHILADITNKLNPNFGIVKKLYTCESGISLYSFSDLENDGEYVASDKRSFEPVRGGYKTADKKDRIEYMEHYNTGQLLFVNNLTKLSRVRRNLTVIFVCINGKSKDFMQKFVLTKTDLENWEHCLSYIAMMMDMPFRNIKFLYDTNGNKICGPWELQHGGIYVAVGYDEKFVKCDYDAWLDTVENMKIDIPIIKKDKNLPCFHKKQTTPSWQKDIQWRTCMKDGFLDCSIFEASIFNSNKFVFDKLPDVNKYACKCIYYKVMDDKPVPTTDYIYQEEHLDDKPLKERSTTERKYYSDSRIQYHNDYSGEREMCCSMTGSDQTCIQTQHCNIK